MADNIKVYFGNSTVAQSMHYGMRDVIDVAGYRAAFPAPSSAPKTFRESFDGLMGFYDTHPYDVACFDLRTKTFAAKETLLRYTDVFAAPNYAKLDFGGNDVYYCFITSQTPQNNYTSIFTFEIDWFHTIQCLYETMPKLRQGYVVRDNKHIIKEPRTGIKVIDCGRGKEDVVPFEMPLLIDETPYEYALANLSTFSDRDIRYIRFTFSQSDVSQELFSQGINAQRDELGTGLVYGFLPLIPRGTYSYVRQVFGAYQIGVNYDEYLARTNALTRALTLAPTCVSVELIPSAPFVKSVSSLQTTQGNLGIEINFDTDVVVGITPTIESLKDKIVLIQTGIDNTHIVPKVNEYKAALNTGYVNSPPLTCAYTATTFASDYKHTFKRSDKPLEPKLGQLQYASTQIRDNIGGALDIDTLAPNGDIEKIQVVADYTGSTFKRKWYVSDNERAYMNDINGRHYCAISDKMNGYPLVNNAYIDYMNGRRNQVINGLAVSQASGWANFASGAISDWAQYSLDMMNAGLLATSGAKNAAMRGATAQIGATANAGSSLGSGAINAIQSALASKWNFEAQTADLKEQANGVERSTGNNPEFDVIDNNGTITRYIWRTSEKDTRRLVEYFHRNGYAVGEWQSDISLDTMYYFDYLQVQDIEFYKTGTNADYEYSVDKPRQMPIECEKYIRDLFAGGVRIWHGRRDGGTYNNPTFFKTSYLNTAKEY